MSLFGGNQNNGPDSSLKNYGNAPDSGAPDAFEQQDEPQHPALKGFSRIKESIKYVLRKTFSGVGKGALIGAIALPVMGAAAVAAGAASIPFGLPLLAAGTAFSTTVKGFFATQAINMALSGAVAGAGLGGVIGGGVAMTDVGDAVDREEEKTVLKYNRQKQLAENQRIMEQMSGQKKMMTQTGGMGGYSPNLSPQLQGNMAQPKQGKGLLS